MGKNIYYILPVLIIALGQYMPQEGEKKRNYILLMALIHAFVGGFRYKYLTGDLIKYEAGFNLNMGNGWFSEAVFDEGRNFGFSWFEKLINNFISTDFQWVLIISAIIIELTLAIIIIRHSPLPWLSYLMWDCVGFYTFGFSALKQSLAMGVLVPACDALLRDKPWKFYIWTALAGCIHAPALIFLPAYIITHGKRRLTPLFYVGSAFLIYVFRDRFLDFLSQFYYEKDQLAEMAFNYGGSLGGRFFMIIMLLLLGITIKGLSGEKFKKVFRLIGVAAVLQVFSSYDNVFTRLTDYYFQFVVLFVPMLFINFEKNGTNRQLFRLNQKQIHFSVVVVVVFSCWFYNHYIISFHGPEVDDYTNYRFNWEVKTEGPKEDVLECYYSSL